MKKIILLILALIVSVQQYAQQEVFIGMSIEQVKKIFPDAEESHYENTTTLTWKATFYGLEDNIGYRFEEGKLNWIFFHKYISEINEENFNKCLIAAQQIIADYSKTCGEPDTTIIGDTTFIDPYKKRHWGYDVIQARWKNYKNMKIKVEFTFFGGKGEYHFIVSINCFDKDYPYYD